jgi:flagellar assembly protein FliH
VRSYRYPSIQTPLASPDLLSLTGGQGCKARDAALQQEIAAAVEAARKQGFQDGYAQASAAAVQTLEQERMAIASALGDFALSRTQYFRRVEGDAVRLALSIARKVLHREAQMDPLLLAGVVRVALDQMQAGTRVVLRTSTESAPGWAEFCSRQLPKDHAVEVVPDSSLEAHRCILQADLGSTEISPDAQLQEIESGFFDLLRDQAEEAP